MVESGVSIPRSFFVWYRRIITIRRPSQDQCRHATPCLQNATFPGHFVEYLRRHDEIWPELKKLLTDSGISDCSIFLDQETNILIGVLKVEDPAVLDELPKHPVMQRWWTHMKDIMATNSDHSPVSIPLKEVFHLP